MFFQKLIQASDGSRCKSDSVSCLPAPWCTTITDLKGCRTCECNSEFINEIVISCPSYKATSYKAWNCELFFKNVDDCFFSPFFTYMNMYKFVKYLKKTGIQIKSKKKKYMYPIIMRYYFKEHEDPFNLKIVVDQWTHCQQERTVWFPELVPLILEPRLILYVSELVQPVPRGLVLIVQIPSRGLLGNHRHCPGVIDLGIYLYLYNNTAAIWK